jgi:hypothetical protein
MKKIKIMSGPLFIVYFRVIINLRAEHEIWNERYYKLLSNKKVYQ